jgi:hypothetical protein
MPLGGEYLVHTRWQLLDVCLVDTAKTSLRSMSTCRDDKYVANYSFIAVFVFQATSGRVQSCQGQGFDCQG